MPRKAVGSGERKRQSPLRRTAKKTIAKKGRTPRRLTERRLGRIREFLRVYIQNPRQYGAMPSNTWIDNLIQSLEERRNDVNKSDVLQWIRAQPRVFQGFEAASPPAPVPRDQESPSVSDQSSPVPSVVDLSSDSEPEVDVPNSDSEPRCAIQDESPGTSARLPTRPPPAPMVVNDVRPTVRARLLVRRSQVDNPNGEETASVSVARVSPMPRASNQNQAPVHPVPRRGPTVEHQRRIVERFPEPVVTVEGSNVHIIGTFNADLLRGIVVFLQNEAFLPPVIPAPPDDDSPLPPTPAEVFHENVSVDTLIQGTRAMMNACVRFHNRGEDNHIDWRTCYYVLKSVEACVSRNRPQTAITYGAPTA